MTRMTHEELKAKILSTIQELAPVRRRFLETSFSRYRPEVVRILDYLQKDNVIKTTGKGARSSPEVIELVEPIPMVNGFEKDSRLPRWKKEAQERQWKDIGELAYYQGRGKNDWPRIGKLYSPIWYRCKNSWLAGWTEGRAKELLEKDEDGICS